MVTIHTYADREIQVYGLKTAGQSASTATNFYVASSDVPVDHYRKENLDSMKTGPRLKMNMHECTHFHYDGTVSTVGPASRGGSSCTWGLSPAFVPANGYLVDCCTYHPTFNGRPVLFPGSFACFYARAINHSSAYGRLNYVEKLTINGTTWLAMYRYASFFDGTNASPNRVTYSYVYLYYGEANRWTNSVGYNITIPTDDLDLIPYGDSSPLWTTLWYRKAKRFVLDFTKSYIQTSGIVAPTQVLRTWQMHHSNRKVLDQVVGELRYYLRTLPIPEAPSQARWGDMSQSCINNCKMVDINTSVWLKEVFSISQDLRKLLGTFTGPITPKTIASLHLSNKYGLKLTIADSCELLDGLNRKLSEVSNQYGLSVSRVRAVDELDFGSRRINYTIYYDSPTNALLRTIKAGLDWDILPTMQNMWDTVPYSFVADWFVDIESLCTTIDTLIYEQYLNVYQVVYTFKDQYAHLLPDPFSGGLFMSIYQRRIADTTHPYYLDLDRSDRWKDNLGTGTALIIVSRH